MWGNNALLTENHRPVPLDVRHSCHQKLNWECLLLRKQTWKGNSGTFSTPWIRLLWDVRLVHPQLSCLRKVLCLLGQPVFCLKDTLPPFRWACAFCKGKKKWGCIYTFISIFKLQLSRRKEGGAWWWNLEIEEISYRQEFQGSRLHSKDCVYILH